MDKHRCNASCKHGVSSKELSFSQEEFREAGRSFLKSTLSASASASTVAALGITMSPNVYAQSAKVGSGRANHYYIHANDKTVHWGYFSKSLVSLVTQTSGYFVTIESPTHHPNDDAEQMKRGNEDSESVFYRDAERKGVDR